MKERFPSLIALFLLLALVVGTWWAADYTQRAVQNDPPRRYTHEMDSWSRNFTMVRTDVDGKPINRLEGDYGEHYPDDDSYVVTMPRAVGLRPGSPVTIGTSLTGTMYEGGKRIVMEKQAHLHRMPDADTPPMDVHSEKLIILPDDDVMYTDLPALVTRGKSTMNGTGMKYNNKTRQLEVFSASNVNIDNTDTQGHSSSSGKSGNGKAADDAKPAPSHTESASQQKKP
ncbi:LPS export ABC transporter periplasmic protein LptC [Bordetella genomosp. 10]|uniref:LPS export ABC transporter periplasmic protein LptC n=1 Tax=Bordetella genomosp. 10 TaxID=1416804 RepID=A0A261SHX5_9BORD|nr:LPS export ABC transporter periplasmic protein LptC [Bordetella genomosp. 10]OZI37038.1 LPS export ABC transporter periplasmic protein LptC [Bordetella genomosp. 10]